MIARYTELRLKIGPLYGPLLVLQGLALMATGLPSLFPSGPVRGGISALIPLVVDPLITGMSLALAVQGLAGLKLGYAQAWQQALRTWGRLLATSLLTVGCAIAPTGGFFYLCYGLFEQAVLAQRDFITIALPFGGMILLALPGIYVGVRLLVTVPILFLEPLNPVAALRRSWALTKGRWWEAALAFMPLGGLIILLGLPLYAGVGMVGFTWAMRLVGPLGWTFYMLYCQHLAATRESPRF